MRVQIVLFDGFDLLDVVAPYEVFTAAAMYSEEELSVEFVSAEGKGMVTSGVNQVQLQSTGRLDLPHGGIIVVPGASGSVHDNGPDSVPVKLQQASQTNLSDLLKKAMKQPDILLCTVCGGSLILAMEGLLEGRHAVTHHMGMELLSATDAIPVQARVVDDGDLVTGGGVTSGLDVSLYLVERELGPRIANAIEQLFEYERRGTVWKAFENKPKEESQLQNQTKTEITGDRFLGSTNGSHHVEGEWDTTISTLIGNLSVLLDLTSKGGRLAGTAKQGGDIVTLDNLEHKENNLTWSMKVTKPMRLTLKFNVFVDKDNLFGEAKAGMLPASKLTGHRIS